ncbi:energy-coupling factor transporter transmembrane protein EcfT ['Fragaria x ananassa' phyllody phytoplasma]|uniref:Energy-coupling factor transporter transmembrane protein EcfT n=1 Tax='Fragaria x ananassa' phyllody phytoplasma TaxID=2358428 RepID=A0ABS5K2Y7_9MOLU|nr:energy-coupling factor transporter transmembrane component T ['Fragaria x ananassa' phyllody phytoplasma]MBS2126228.1 energy-coupling factor transporter transmembrane protein EcfT ['Fragaria x ananassa' phyllody phytoplasma]
MNKQNLTTSFLKPTLINQIHPSLKIIVFIFLLILVLYLPINIVSNSNLMDVQNCKIFAFYLIAFVSLVASCCFLGLDIRDFWSKIKNLRFFLLFSLLLNLTKVPCSQEVWCPIKVFNYHSWAFGVLVIFFLFYHFTQKKITFKLYYFLFLFGCFFIIPSYLISSLPSSSNFNCYYLPQVAGVKIILIMMRLLMIIMFFFIFNKITSFMEIQDGLEMILSPLKKLKIPIDIFTLMLSLIFMANSFLLQETNKILKAQISRGMDLHKKNIFKKIHHLLSLLIPIFVLVFKRSMILSNAMEIRGYVLGVPRTKMRVYRLHKIDFGVILIALLFLGLKLLLF